MSDSDPADNQGPAAGDRAEVSLVVGDADTAIAHGSGDVAVLATPRVVALVEEAAVAAISGAFDDDTTTVGTRIELDHLAPSPIGSEVTAWAEVTSAQRRRVDFTVGATMAGTDIAAGHHTRVTVRREGFGT